MNKKTDDVIKYLSKDGYIGGGTLGINKNKPVGYKMPVPPFKKGIKKRK